MQNATSTLPQAARTRWIILAVVWLAVALLLLYQTLLMREYLGSLTALGLSGHRPVTPLSQIFTSPDGELWIRHALDLLHGSGPQLRHTFFDNPPAGREVHWDSAWAWTIAGFGALIHACTSLRLSEGVEQGAIWLSPIVHLCLIVLLSSLLLKRLGLVAAVVVAIGLACDDTILQIFPAGNVDHHGIIAGAIALLLLGAIFMGGGWWHEGESPLSGLMPSSLDSARQGARLSALGGATAMWLGAASAIPPIAFVGLAGVLVSQLQGKKALAEGARCDPDLWRLWGRTGAIISVIFYLLEYFPNHLGLRLEVNHPLYALAWYGGGELVAQCCEWKLRTAVGGFRVSARTVAALIAIIVAPVVILVGREQVFLLFDPLIARLHTAAYVVELRSVAQSLSPLSGIDVTRNIGYDLLPIILAVVAFCIWRRRLPLVISFALMIGIPLTAMGWWQVRWLPTAAVIGILLVAIMVSLLSERLRPTQRWGGVALASLILYLPSPWLRNVGAAAAIHRGEVDDEDRMNAVYRDVAGALRTSQPTGPIVVMSSPTTALGVSYYGEFSAVGALYWENAAGVRAAADFYSATGADEARRVALDHQVTHLVIIPRDNFVQSYFEVRHPGEDLRTLSNGFIYGLIQRGEVPDWMEQLPYLVPSDLRAITDTVLIYRLRPDPRTGP